MKIVSWNVNGIRSVMKKGFLEWLREEDPDIVCLQETKIGLESLPEEFKQLSGYYAYFNAAQKPGYAGVAVYTKVRPQQVMTELHSERFDTEGRCLVLRFDDFVLFNFYMPNGWASPEHFVYKMAAYDHVRDLLSREISQPAIVCGDLNIAHTDLDLGFTVPNSACSTPEERLQLSKLLSDGWIDVHRALNGDRRDYTWWQPGIPREKNMGWRLDYFLVSPILQDNVQTISSQREVMGSDHSPVVMTIDVPFVIHEIPQHEKSEPQPTLF